MAPKRSSRTKQASGLSQPQLSFQTRKHGSTKSTKKAALHPTVSDTSIVSDSDRSVKRAQTTDDERLLSTVEESEAEAAESSQRSPKAKNVDTDMETQAGDENGSKKKGPRRQLDVKSKRWNGVVKAARAEMAGMEPIHAGPDTHNDIHHVLRVFDMTSSYGPYVGISRLSRWQRAKKLGLEPPEEIREILTTRQGEEDVRYRENVLYEWLG